MKKKFVIMLLTATMMTAPATVFGAAIKNDTGVTEIFMSDSGISVNGESADDIAVSSVTDWYGCPFGVPVIINAIDIPEEMLDDNGNINVDGIEFTQNSENIGFDVKKRCKKVQDISDFNGEWHLKYVDGHLEDEAKSTAFKAAADNIKIVIENGKINVKVAFTDIASIAETRLEDGIIKFDNVDISEGLNNVVNTNEFKSAWDHCEIALIDNNTMSITVFAKADELGISPISVSIFADRTDK